MDNKTDRCESDNPKQQVARKPVQVRGIEILQ
jgi:hypothetical protein